MDEDDPVRVALLRIGGRDEEADVERGEGQRGRDAPQPRQQGAGQRIEARRRGEGEPADAACHVDVYSSEMRNAAAVAGGAVSAVKISSAPRIE